MTIKYELLKKGGTFCGCFYIQGECVRADGVDHAGHQGVNG